MNYIEKELEKIYENVCVYGTKITFIPLLKLYDMHMQDNIKIWTLDNDLIDKVNSINDITNCFNMGENEVLWLEEQYQTKCNEKTINDTNIVYAKECKQLLEDLIELDYLTTRHYEQKHIVAVAGTIDNPKYEDGLSLDNGEILAVFQEKQTKRNRVNAIETESGLTKTELLALL